MKNLLDTDKGRSLMIEADAAMLGISSS